MIKLYLDVRQALLIPEQQTEHAVLVDVKQKRCLDCTSCNDIEIIHHINRKI